MALKFTAHGQPHCEFLSAAFNQREEQYGGHIENRCHLICEIIQGIKERLERALQDCGTRGIDIAPDVNPALPEFEVSPT